MIAGMLSVVASLPVIASAELRVTPNAVRLDRPEDSLQLLVTDVQGPVSHDATRSVTYEVKGAPIVRVDADGLIHPLAEGTSELVVRSGGIEIVVPVAVTSLNNPPPVSFQHEVQPILTKARCNSGGCHGKAEGQNGFKLSLLGFDHGFDHDALIKEGKGRRLSITAPETSLILRKAIAEVPHGGGRKIEPGSPQYKRLLRWIASGAQAETPDERQVVSIEVEPADLVMTPGGTQQLRVWAIDDRGQKRCATVESDFFRMPRTSPMPVNADCCWRARSQVKRRSWFDTWDMWQFAESHYPVPRASSLGPLKTTSSTRMSGTS
jgi:hypothetical protein